MIPKSLNLINAERLICVTSASSCVLSPLIGTIANPDAVTASDDSIAASKPSPSAFGVCNKGSCILCAYILRSFTKLMILGDEGAGTSTLLKLLNRKLRHSCDDPQIARTAVELTGKRESTNRLDPGCDHSSVWFGRN